MTGYTLEEGEECGYTTDHETEMVYEDDEVEQYECRRCGAEWWFEDKGGTLTPCAP